MNKHSNLNIGFQTISGQKYPPMCEVTQSELHLRDKF